MTLVQLLYALPLGSAVIAGAGILAYLIYMSSEYHHSARPRRTPRESLPDGTSPRLLPNHRCLSDFRQ
jgi:hypothetical protein